MKMGMVFVTVSTTDIYYNESVVVGSSEQNYRIC